MEFIEVSTDKVGSILKGVPILANHPWLLSYPCNITEFFNNDYPNKIITASIMVSGGMVYSLDAIRQKNEGIAIDRRFITLSGSKFLIQKNIHKDFPEHHLSELPDYFKK